MRRLREWPMLSRILATSIVLAALLLCVIGGAVVGLTTPVLGDLRANCAVGIVGSSASITVTGLLAGRACRELLRSSSRNILGLTQLNVVSGRNHARFVLNCVSPNIYELSTTPNQPVVCEYQYGRQRYIVRDEGILKLVGNAVCDKLRQTST